MISEILDGGDRLLMRTLIGLRAGGENFGLSASEGRLCMTLRGHRQADINALADRIEARAREGCVEQGMDFAFELRDGFPDTTNDDALFDDALARFRRAGLPVHMLAEPMRWSEDFGWILKRAPGVYFGIGDGENCPGAGRRLTRLRKQKSGLVSSPLFHSAATPFPLRAERKRPLGISSPASWRGYRTPRRPAAPCP